MGDHGSAGYLTSAPAPTTAQVGSATAGLALDAVGSYAWLGQATAGTFVAGSTYSGSGLKYSGFLSTSVYSDDTAASINGSIPSGTWRAMSNADNQSVRAASGLFLRIS